MCVVFLKWFWDLKFSVLISLSSVSTIRNQRYHIHANLSFAILVAEILLLISARFEPGTVIYRYVTLSSITVQFLPIIIYLDQDYPEPYYY